MAKGGSVRRPGFAAIQTAVGRRELAAPAPAKVTKAPAPKTKTTARGRSARKAS
jgi:hypothetical protein